MYCSTRRPSSVRSQMILSFKLWWSERGDIGNWAQRRELKPHLTSKSGGRSRSCLINSVGQHHLLCNRSTGVNIGSSQAAGVGVGWNIPQASTWHSPCGHPEGYLRKKQKKLWEFFHMLWVFLIGLFICKPTKAKSIEQKKWAYLGVTKWVVSCLQLFCTWWGFYRKVWFVWFIFPQKEVIGGSMCGGLWLHINVNSVQILTWFQIAQTRNS